MCDMVFLIIYPKLSLSPAHPAEILSDHLDWGQMPRPVADPIDRQENQGQRWLQTITALGAGTVSPYLSTTQSADKSIKLQMML